jgi:hypothetical protein
MLGCSNQFLIEIFKGTSLLVNNSSSIPTNALFEYIGWIGCNELPNLNDFFVSLFWFCVGLDVETDFLGVSFGTLVSLISGSSFLFLNDLSKN